nr:MAG TPA: restriction alleviation protein [Bacteriophage sp.]DAS83144.1 MAG TPA: restriction alleviation protein [Caudoviricetes sp.]DAT90893.1 MAG TPA: restriction alleviation protein [Bacteriophage sp.]
MRNLGAVFYWSKQSGRNIHFVKSLCLYSYFMALLQPCNFCSFGKIYIISEINNITDT